MGLALGLGVAKWIFLKIWQIDFKAYSFNDYHTKVWDFIPCSFAFIIWEDKFNFSSDNLINLRNNETLHTVLDWAIGNEIMKVAQNKANYVCGGNSTWAIDLNPNNVCNNLSTKIIDKTFYKITITPSSLIGWLEGINFNGLSLKIFISVPKT